MVTGLRLEVEIDRLMTELDELAGHSDAPRRPSPGWFIPIAI